jgi:hypothetical protein
MLTCEIRGELFTGLLLVTDPMLLSNENGDKETRKVLKLKIKLLCLQ